MPASHPPPPSPTVEKIDNVLLQHRRHNLALRGALTLTSHHLIFQPTSIPNPVTIQVAYSLICNAVRLPCIKSIASTATHSSSSRIYPIHIFQKNFDSYTFGCQSEAHQIQVFDSLKQCAVLYDINQLFAFYYQPQPPASSSSASSTLRKVYDFKAEFTRQGIGSRTKAWRFTDINSQYTFCPSYPAHMAVPSRISDATLGYASKYRSKARIPALTYIHWANHATITRSSQPMVGLKNARSIQDEKLIEAIFTSHHYADPDSVAAKAAVEATANAAVSSSSSSSSISTLMVYGATCTNLIIDARPTTNAMANVARGAGTENMEYYKGCKKTYLGIDNIHVMRDSLNKLTDALQDSEPPATFGTKVESISGASELANLSHPSTTSVSTNRDDGPPPPPPSVSAGAAGPVDPHALRKSAWLKHIVYLLQGTMTIVKNLHINSSHVLIHCSDGWDRTSQLAALAEICLDPYYRTFQGFAVLVEKDWLSFGHRFNERGGFKGNEKYFTVASKNNHFFDDDEPSTADDTDSEPDKPSISSSSSSGGVNAAASAGGFDSQAAANAFWGFTKQLTVNFSAATSGHSSSKPQRGSHIKETSPVFHQFLDCIWQIMRQFPQRFEFNQDFLVQVLQVSQECKFGTFLMDCERERIQPPDEGGPLSTRTVSAWDYLLSPDSRKTFSNPSYQPDLDGRDPKRQGTDMGVLFADPRDVRYFEKLFKRADGEMNAVLDREAEERRRARERLERVVRGETLTPPGTELLDGPDGTMAAAAVGQGDRDPALVDAAGNLIASTESSSTLSPTFSTVPLTGSVPLSSSSSHLPASASAAISIGDSSCPDTSPGAVDLSKLAYQVRKPRNVHPATVTSEPVDVGNPLEPDRSGLVTSNSAVSLATGGGGSTTDTTNRMKNLFLGGWGKIQDAIAVEPSSLASLSHLTGSTDPLSLSESGNENGTLLDRTDVDNNNHSWKPNVSSFSHANPWAVGRDEWREEMEHERRKMSGTTQSHSLSPHSHPHPHPTTTATLSTSSSNPDSSSVIPFDPLGVL